MEGELVIKCEVKQRACRINLNYEAGNHINFWREIGGAWINNKSQNGRKKSTCFSNPARRKLPE